MAIRQRLAETMPSPEYRKGYPDWLFEGFRMRFGRVAAVFTNAKMQAVSGLADNSLILKPGPPAMIHFVYRDGLDRLIAERRAAGTNTKVLQDVLDIWPSGAIPRKHRHIIGDE